MGKPLAYKILENHLVSGRLVPGEEIAIKIDQTLTQDATGTMAYLEFEAIGIDRVKTELSVSYVDHNILQSDFKNADDHRFLQSIAKRYGIWFSKPGNGICHQVHLERFAKPGKTLLGSDSHTPTAGGCGMIAIGAGGLDVAMAMAGKPFYLRTPKIVGVYLEGKLQPWVTARDIALYLLSKLTVKGGLGKILEYFGPGVKHLSVPERATICNLGTEMGATTSIFPSDEITRKWLIAQGREQDFVELLPDENAQYDEIIEVDLSKLEPLCACPSSPDNVKRVAEEAGKPVAQVIIGSCANSSLKDLLVVAKVLEKYKVHPDVSFEVNPGSLQVLENLVVLSGLKSLLEGGTRLHQSGCLGCIGMGQAPPTNSISLRTFTRNFPGRSGTNPDFVYLVSPETAVASAIKGVITDPRELGEYPEVVLTEKFIINDTLLIPPLPEDEAKKVEIIRGPNIAPLPPFDPLPETLEGVFVLKVGDNITTDHIMPAGAQILPLRSNLPAISQFVYKNVDPDFAKKSLELKEKGLAVGIVGGENYGQGSSREHAALAPRYLGVKVKLAKTFARIHRSNLINFGILPLTFENPADYEKISQGDSFIIENIRNLIEKGEKRVKIIIKGKGEVWAVAELTERERECILKGSLLNLAKAG
ncbi:MAG: Aconitate hydratase [Thermodesulfobacterium sp. 37_54]|uniref:Aconitate hydratase n=1 Tax=Thermodesulfobacterium commune TaxID=1741 RepID=A0A101FKB4_9BACT|nr:MAG: Aconitate hydratase [Thermodesulfobacterium sp. 37_54]KUK38600.1 MAG: Aconitate hydratase [Thermodesulfobacterium commune]HAA83829.1 aconitate hydratase [Thermodesulfobacterium commune]